MTQGEESKISKTQARKTQARIQYSRGGREIGTLGVWFPRSDRHGGVFIPVTYSVLTAKRVREELWAAEVREAPAGLSSYELDALQEQWSLEEGDFNGWPP